MATAGEAIEYRCLIHATNGKKTISTSASLQALGDRKGINRFGDFSAPLDEALIHASLDLSGRPHLSYNLDIPTQRVGTYDAQGVQKQLPVGASRVTLLVRNLKKKSLWSRILEEVMEKLVDIVYFLHLEIHEAFGSAGAFKNYK
ncbi:Imidazoleglycerol-phosphate dehydratase [Arachis hypogaea]|nr:Imidazoleglycerol-phosphate dehydratase [Arachis hypogaea]